jgi:hypothetical protein
MANKLKIDGDKINDGSKQVGRIKNGCIYEKNNTSSSYLLAMIKKDVIYNKNNPSSSYCIGMVKNGTIYNKNNPSSSYKVGTIRDAERVITGSCDEAELGAIYILMKDGKL